MKELTFKMSFTDLVQRRTLYLLNFVALFFALHVQLENLAEMSFYFIYLYFILQSLIVHMFNIFSLLLHCNNLTLFSLSVERFKNDIFVCQLKSNTWKHKEQKCKLQRKFIWFYLPSVNILDFSSCLQILHLILLRNIYSDCIAWQQWGLCVNTVYDFSNLKAWNMYRT